MEGFSVTEIPIRQNPRTAGRSHYNIGNRLFSSFYDLLAVSWMKKRMFRYEIAERIEAGAEMKAAHGRADEAEPVRQVSV
jgi:hypothetical protein